MNISKAKFEQAMARERQQLYFGEFSQEYGRDVLAQDRLTTRLAALPAEFDVRDILPPLNLAAPDYPNWSKQILWVAKLAVASVADGYMPEELVVEGNYLPENSDDDLLKLIIIPGNLTVTGNLIQKSILVVLGDVWIHGAYIDTCNYSETVVAGNLWVGKSLLTEAPLGVGSRLTAPFMFLSYNQGATVVLGGCTATMLIESDHGGSQIFGDSTIDYLVVDELHLYPTQDANGEEMYKNMSQLFQPAFVEAFAARYAALRHLEEQDTENSSISVFELRDEFESEFNEALCAGFMLENPAVFKYAEAG